MTLVSSNSQFRHLMYVTLLANIALMLLLWNYSPDRTRTTDHSRINKSLPQIPVQEPVPPQCGLGRVVSLEEFVPVKGTKTMLFSAYREHRVTPKKVRVIAVVLRREKVDYRCLLCCQERMYTSTGIRNINSDHFGFQYGTADIMCPLPSGCENPSHITVTSAAANSEEKHEKLFLEVQNQNAKRDSFSYNFTVCFSTMFDFKNVLQLVQSLEMLQLLGVNRVVIYKTSSSPETQRILNYYTQKGLLEVIPWSMSRFLNVSRGFMPEYDPGDIHYFGQIPALNDCLYRYMYQSRYIALQDVDELILPQSANSWLELLPRLKKQYGHDRCYMFENFVFPITVTLPPPPPENLTLCCPGWQFVPGPNILQHLYHEPNHEILWSNFKIIINPRAVFALTVHGVLNPHNVCSWVGRSIARLYHTRAPMKRKLTSDKLVYNGRLLSYSSRLIPAVNTVLTESGLLPQDDLE